MTRFQILHFYLSCLYLEIVFFFSFFQYLIILLYSERGIKNTIFYVKNVFFINYFTYIYFLNSKYLSEFVSFTFLVLWMPKFFIYVSFLKGKAEYFHLWNFLKNKTPTLTPSMLMLMLSRDKHGIFAKTRARQCFSSSKTQPSFFHKLIKIFE